VNETDTLIEDVGSWLADISRAYGELQARNKRQRKSIELLQERVRSHERLLEKKSRDHRILAKALCNCTEEIAYLRHICAKG